MLVIVRLSVAILAWHNSFCYNVACTLKAEQLASLPKAIFQILKVRTSLNKGSIEQKRKQKKKNTRKNPVINNMET